jgi:hypothetical protein
MTVAADRQFTLQFDGALTMTHHATNLDLPSEANITTAAGDVATFQSTGSNTVQCVSYTRADGTAVVGSAEGTAVLSTGEAGGTKYLREDGDGTSSWQTVAAGISSKQGYATRDASTASGSQAITGIGFQPVAIVIFGYESQSGYVASWTLIDSDGDGTGFECYPTTQFEGPRELGLFAAGGDYNYVSGVTCDADGFTLTWVKGGTPTGTLNLSFLCLA